MSGLMAKEDACIGYVDEVVEVGVLFENGLEIILWDLVRAGS